MRRSRDNQRSRVYAWEREQTRWFCKAGLEFDTIEDVAVYMNPIWRSERGRYGRAKVPAPALHHGHRGQRSAIAYHSHKISLPRAMRNEWVILHEMAHRLTPVDEAHGPRFVGCLIGLLARHAGWDAAKLMESAEAAGVNCHVRSIGSVPVIEPALISERLAALMPVFYMTAATELDVSYRVIYGAAIRLIKDGRARWSGKTLVPL